MFNQERINIYLLKFTSSWETPCIETEAHPLWEDKVNHVIPLELISREKGNKC